MAASKEITWPCPLTQWMSKAAAVQEHIREAFRSVHNDQRTREEVTGEHKPICTQVAASKKLADAYLRAALRSPHIAEHVAQRRDVPCYVIAELRRALTP
jgi:hypothetical protein